MAMLHRALEVIKSQFELKIFECTGKMVPQDQHREPVGYTTGSCYATGEDQLASGTWLQLYYEKIGYDLKRNSGNWTPKKTTLHVVLC